MENRYYTPALEEFHIGFEYEQKIGEDNWEYRKIKDRYDLFDACMNIARVKYLDQSDIESLGFEHKQYVPERNICLNFEYKEWYLNYWFGEIPNVEIRRDGYDDGFFGKCKNKSELKRILNQLNIK